MSEKHRIRDASTLAAIWSKDHHSNPSGECLEVASMPDGAVAMRNSCDPSGPAVVVSRATFEEFADSARCGDLDWLVDGDESVRAIKGGVLIQGEGSYCSGPGYDGGPYPQVGLDHHM